MHILYLYQYFGTPKGSWSTRVYEISKFWIEQGVKVTVITSPYDKSDIRINSKKLVSRCELDGIELIIINAGDSNRFSKLKRIKRAILFALISSFYAIRIKCDVVISSSGPITIGIPGLIATFISKKKFVFEVRDLWPSGAIEMGLINSSVAKRIALYFEKICYKKSDLIVACSEGMESDISERYGYRHTIVIPNACDFELFNKVDANYEFPDWLKDTDKLLIYTGSLGFMDACDEIILGFNLIKEKLNVKLVFIGDGTERKSLEKLVNDLKLNQYVHFMGLISKNEVVQWYQRSLISFVVFKNFPVLSTSSPNKMFDSFAAGVPVIQNTKGWISKLIDEKNLGFNVESNNPIDMSRVIQQSLTQRELLETMKFNALQVAKNDFNREYLAMNYLKSLNEFE